VPGPRAPMYWQGCELDGMYPASVVVDTMALNITLISRAEAVDFGLIACRRTLPHVQRLLDHLQTALEELEAALGPAAP
jgi:diacylglycerol O-acyltransferase / wax synthase